MKQDVRNTLAATAKTGTVKAASRWNLLGKRKLIETEMRGASFA
jgi:hypothetical protein